ncbi:uncharacterized protein ASPGLDRAFT_354716 [Aspergillus glaucus CBS 516.65]|uniref:Transmembrane protein n=1 Tax=Aspergillus glaucus CBS 516.65 TaxID=1160497 RepID=A0A1L9VIX1_ASPGL|nr:hypothetical protein ASPGLDRAFT_354716 [Aspergillus glaucus CBS 516.65]OJJ83876.1 hypothetical protein ASPGLDRAFT_354716 [Aspergillus glaucus CBS 516.65]
MSLATTHIEQHQQCFENKRNKNKKHVLSVLVIRRPHNALVASTCWKAFLSWLVLVNLTVNSSLFYSIGLICSKEDREWGNGKRNGLQRM